MKNQNLNSHLNMTQALEKAQRRLALVERAESSRQFNPEMLMLAREFHGMTIKDLSDRIGTTPSYVCQLESGLREPSENVMERLTEALKFPQQHYYEQGRRESEPLSFYRRRIMVSPILLRQSSARMTEIKRNLEKLLSQVDSIQVRLEVIDPEECAGG